MPELYYAIMNILDYIALNEPDNRQELIKICDALLSCIDCSISDLSSANDCGLCNTWEVFIEALKRLHLNGERI